MAALLVAWRFLREGGQDPGEHRRAQLNQVHGQRPFAAGWPSKIATEEPLRSLSVTSCTAFPATCSNKGGRRQSPSKECQSACTSRTKLLPQIIQVQGQSRL